jgi:peptide-methionine (R)-S-oxide reductase
MPGGPLMIKFLVMGTLLLGFLALLVNIMPTGRQNLRSRRMLGTVRSPIALVVGMVGQDTDDENGAEMKATNNNARVGKVLKTEEEWKAELTEQQYQVTRCSGTERPFTGNYWNHHQDGTYTCVGCGQELFSSDTKYDSGSGWPSYYKPVDADAVDEIKDISYGVVRTEIVCSRCEAHLGHVFPDGPRPTGQRFCINSASLDFVKQDQGQPAEKTNPSAD